MTTVAGFKNDTFLVYGVFFQTKKFIFNLIFPDKMAKLSHAKNRTEIINISEDGQKN